MGEMKTNLAKIADGYQLDVRQGTERCGKIKMMENQVLKLDVESKGRE